MMDRDTHLQPGEVNKIDLRSIFQEIREDVEKATSREALAELYKQTGYYITLTHATPINEKVDPTVKEERGIAEQEFARTVRKINDRAKKIGTEADFNESWEKLATNDYESEGKNLLEPEESVGE
jgi:Icc-related predicted phosphoesterase